jgi:gamma-glutamyltranspeptidase/glutathione hydrolase
VRAGLAGVASLAFAGLPAAAASPALENTATGMHGAVATDQHLATETGIRILREGGNAVDAAVAIGYTLAATYPDAGNLGGGGFMLVRFADGGAHFIDFRETAPAAATRDMYLDAHGNAVPERSIVGALSAGVPGSVAGLEYARERFGTLPRHELLRDAIAYAANGFTFTAGDAATFARANALLVKFPATKAIFAPSGSTPGAGAVLVQPALAATLRAIDERGATGFYEGDVAHRLAAAVRAGGGIITEGDLAAYRPVERDPLTCRHAGMTIVTSPPPSSGGLAICEILGIIGDDKPLPPLRSFANAHLEIEAERRAFADRNTSLGDPDFVPSPVARLLAPAYLAQLRASIAPVLATPSLEIHGGGVALHEGSNTTNYSVVDAAGTAVDVTYTLNNSFGSGFVAGDTGVLLNDEMDDFTAKAGAPNMFGLVQGAANAIAPGKRPLSSMSPSIVVDGGGRVVLVAGAAGGPRIITTTLDAIRGTVDFGETVAAALAAPRVHMQWLPDVVYAEDGAFDPATLARLTAAGYHLEAGRAGSAANAIGVAPDGARTAAHDPRFGVAAGSALAY